MPESPQKVFSDRYEIVRHIARGGMAQVYLARDVLLDRPVALKVLFPELSVDQSFVERFRREAKAAANLSHPNIVSVYDWGQGDGTYFIVMEFVDGPTLSSMLRQGPIAPQRAASIAGSVAAALDFAHRRGVIHRDVKPGNVLIDGRGQVKVADFGIARAAGTAGDLTQTGSVMGTATYFSPEQAQGHPVDARSDVYSLGVVLYEMLTGKPPFTGDNPVSIAYKHVKEEPTRPTTMVRGIPVPLEAIALKAMAKDPAMRYQTADDFRQDLERFAHRQQVLAASEATAVLGAAGAAGVVGNREATRVQGAAARTSVLPAAAGAGAIGAGAAGAAAARRGGPNSPAAAAARRRRRNTIIALLVILALLIAAAIYFGGRHAGWWGSSAKQLTVPAHLRGEPLANAQNQLHALGFTNVRSVNKHSSTISAGDVISSNPPGGTVMKSNALLTLDVSEGALQVNVPDVAGRSQAAAGQMLTRAGFVPKVEKSYSSTVKQGYVISTDPAGNTQASQGSTVILTVSNGRQQVDIPSFAGDSPATAGQKLGSLGLNVQPATEPSATVPAGEVTRTDPPAGTNVAVGSTVTLYTSTGKPTTTVPRLQGDTRSQAQAALSNANLQASFSTVSVTDPTQNGIVQSWSPTTGQTVDQGTTVNVTIGQYTPAPTTSTSSTTIPTTSSTT